MIKVLYATNIPAPYKVEFFNRLAEECDLTVTFERKTASDRESEWKTKEDVKYKEIYLSGIRYSNDASVSLELIKFLKTNAFDVIIFGVYHTLTAMLTMQYLYLKKRPFVLSSDGGFKKKEFLLKRFLKMHFIKMANWYLSPGGKTDEYLLYYGAKKEKIYKYPFTSVAKEDVTDKDEIDLIRKKIGIKTDKVILSVGQFIYRKGFDILFDAIAILDDKDIHAYIVGGKPTEEYLKKIQLLGIGNRIHFVDFITKSELKDYYMAADVLCLPTREDIWGLVVVEALACGLPVISTDRCNAAIELIKNGENGFIIKSENSLELAEAIEKVFHENQEILRENACNTVSNYTYTEMVQAHIKFMKSMSD